MKAPARCATAVGAIGLYLFARWLSVLLLQASNDWRPLDSFELVTSWILAFPLSALIFMAALGLISAIGWIIFGD